jgi:hypothetical protein
MNTQTKHTPGPWTEHEGFICGRFCDGNVYDICDPRCAPAELFEEIDANARLIAASPDLLAACESALALLTDPNAEPRDADALTAMLLTAIAKAKGEA